MRGVQDGPWRPGPQRGFTVTEMRCRDQSGLHCKQKPRSVNFPTVLLGLGLGLGCVVSTQCGLGLFEFCPLLCRR